MSHFIENTNVRGCLAIIYSTTRISVYYEVIERNGSQLVHATVVPDGEYNVSFFLFDENGFPLSRAANIPRRVSLSGSKWKNKEECK